LLTSTTDTQGDRLATLRLQPDAETQQTQLQEQQLETLRSALPVARALPLLKALAQQEPSRLLLPYLAGLGLRVEITPC
jgi:hypothetical protein